MQRSTHDFAGVVSGVFSLPGFVVPVLRNVADYFVQIVDEATDQIIEFAPLEPGEVEIQESGTFPMGSQSEISFAESVYARKLNDRALYGVRFPSMDIVIQEADGIRQLVKSRIYEFDSYPAAQLELAEFIGEAHLLANVSARTEKKRLKRSKIASRARQIEAEIKSSAKTRDAQEIGDWLCDRAEDEPTELRLAFNSLRVNREDEVLRERIFSDGLVASLKSLRDSAHPKGISHLVHIAGIAGCKAALPEIKARIRRVAELGGETVADLMEATTSFSSEDVSSLVEELVDDTSISLSVLPASLMVTSNRHDYANFFKKYVRTSRANGGIDRLVRIVESEEQQET